MAKPILITRIPDYPYTQSQIDHIRFNLENCVPDYNHLIVKENISETIEFEVFNVQTYRQIDFDELKIKLERNNWLEPDLLQSALNKV